jgi:hypothetical protein
MVSTSRYIERVSILSARLSRQEAGFQWLDGAWADTTITRGGG